MKAKKARSNNYFLIEVKGDASEKSRYPNLVSALGEIAQRYEHELHYRFGIALPKTYTEVAFRRVPCVQDDWV